MGCGCGKSKGSVSRLPSGRVSTGAQTYKSSASVNVSKSTSGAKVMNGRTKI